MREYLFNINNLSDDLYYKWYSLLNPIKKSKIDNLYLINDKKRSVCGDMLAKTALSELTGIKAEEIIIDTDSNGKPFPVNVSLHFNISHCEDYVVCVTHDSPIGVDIEKIRPINLKIAEKFFNKDEQKYIFCHEPTKEDFLKEPSPDLLERFFRVWTKKEAFLKYTGEGICADLKSIEIDSRNLKTKIEDGYVITIYHN